MPVAIEPLAAAPRIILTRPLNPAHLEGGAILDEAERAGRIELVRWTKDKPVDRQWLLDELRQGGTEGLVCMHNGEKVRSAPCPRALPRAESYADLPVSSSLQIDDELLDAGAPPSPPPPPPLDPPSSAQGAQADPLLRSLRAAGPSLKVVSTMSAGFDHVDTAALKKRGVRLGSSASSSCSLPRAATGN